MAQSAALEPSGLPHPNDGYPQDQLASILRGVIMEQDGNTNPSHHAVLFLMELRADLDNRHFFVDVRHEPEYVTRDIDEAMHLSKEFLQSITDLDGAFALTVQPCLDLARRIRHVTETYDVGDSDAVATIKRLRKYQSKRLHHLQGRWEDLLQTAREFDESVTFERLSNIVEYTEEAVHEAWLYAKVFMASCEEMFRYCLNDTFLAKVYTPEPLPLSPTGHIACKPSSEENPELAVLHHTPAVSRVNTTAVCATVAHHVIPCNETSPFGAALGRSYQTTDNDTVNLSPLGPERKGHTPVYDPGSVHGTVTKRHLDDLSATLDAQTQRVGDMMTDTIRQIKDKVTLAEMDTLISAAGESVKKTTCFLTTRPPAHVNRARSTTHKQTTNAFLVRTTRTENASQTRRRSYKGNPEQGDVAGIVSECRRTTTTQVDTDGIVPTEKIKNQSEDHNWRWRKRSTRCAEEAVFEEKWPHLGTSGKQHKYINKQRHPGEPVEAQVPKQTDGHQIVNTMNNSLRGRFQALHLSTWIPIRDEADEEPEEPSQQRFDTIITERPLPNRADTTQTTDDAIERRITTAYEIARQAPKIPLPKNASDAQEPFDDEDAIQHPQIVECETGTLGEVNRQKQYPSTRAILRRSSSSSPEDPTGNSRPQTDNPDTTDNHDHQNPFHDTLVTEQVLFGGNPGAENNPDTNDKSGEDSRSTCDAQEASDNDSTAATFAGCGGDEGESGVGNYSLASADSDGSSTGGAARTRTRPVSWILQGDSYVALTDFRCRRNSWANRANHNCQTCKDGSRCWCPDRNRTTEATPPGGNSRQQHRRRSRRRSLNRCSTCNKMYIIYGTSRQWCCYDWVSGSSESSSTDR